EVLSLLLRVELGTSASHRFGDAAAEIFELEGFDDELIDAALDRRGGGVDVRMGAHQDHPSAGRAGTHLDQQVEPGGPGKTEIREHEVEPVAAQKAECLGDAARRLDVVPDAGEVPAEQPTEVRLVIDDED